MASLCVTMVRPKISVVILSDKFGGLDITVDGLKKQTFKDFEVLLIDELYEKRKGLVTDYFVENGIADFRHLPIERNLLLWRTFCAATNTGIIHAETEDCVVTLCDFLWIPPEFLGNAWQLHEAFKGKAAFSGFKHWSRSPPVTRPDNPIQIHERPFDGTKYEFHFYMNHEPSPALEPDLAQALLNTDHSWIAQDVMAFPMEGLVRVNGYDERYDKEVSDSPWDLATRLVLAGYLVFLTKHLNGYHIEHAHSVRPIPNSTIFPTRYRQYLFVGNRECYYAPNAFNLAELKAKK